MANNLDEIVHDIEDLVSLPGVFVQINQLIDDPTCTSEQIAEVISRDPGLTVRVLRVANSPMYGLRAEIETVSKAVTIIGMKRIRDLVLATSAVGAFDKIPNDLLSMENFWMHSIYCGLMAKFLAEHLKMSNSDSLFIAGLLHDIGHLVMFKRIPELAKKALIDSIDKPEEPDLYLSERDIIGYDHAQVGAKLAKDWHLPELFVEAIEFHHEPEKADKYKKEIAIVHIANSLAVLPELNTTDLEETNASKIHPSIWELIGLDDTIIVPAYDNAKQRYSEMYGSLFPKSRK